MMVGSSIFGGGGRVVHPFTMLVFVGLLRSLGLLSGTAALGFLSEPTQEGVFGDRQKFGEGSGW